MLTKAYDTNLPPASIPQCLRRLRYTRLHVPLLGAVYQAASGAGLADGRLAADPMRSGEVLASVSGLVGEEDVGRTPAKLSGIAADAFCARESIGPDYGEGVDGMRGAVSSSAAEAQVRILQHQRMA